MNATKIYAAVCEEKKWSDKFMSEDKMKANTKEEP